MSPQFNRFDGMSIFDDKGEVKRLVAKVVQERDSGVTIDRMRKMDFSYVFILFKRGRSKEVELTRSEIEASWDWKNGNIDETLQRKIETTLSEL
ncbi:MAG: hypothetical protein QME83_04535 [Thermodesulfobacteriota bacterium]|nr:hypothetical protein [Thermodesulfobacteriota bacterium]